MIKSLGLCYFGHEGIGLALTYCFHFLVGAHTTEIHGIERKNPSVQMVSILNFRSYSQITRNISTVSKFSGKGKKWWGKVNEYCNLYLNRNYSVENISIKKRWRQWSKTGRLMIKKMLAHLKTKQFICFYFLILIGYRCFWNVKFTVTNGLLLLFVDRKHKKLGSTLLIKKSLTLKKKTQS